MTDKIALVLVPTFIHTIEQRICSGIAEAFSDQAIRVIFAPLQYLPESAAQLDRCLWIHHQFRALQPSVLIGYGGGLGYVSGNGSYEKILALYQGIPIVNIGSAVPDVANVLVDNFDGMYELMVDIVARRSTARFLYLSGPVGNVDSQIRQHALYRAFEESGRSSTDIEVLVGNFTTFAARTLIDAYLAAGSWADVIVCGNDLSAKGVLDSLKAHGIECPGQCWVTGYDDFEYAAAMLPGLTTVHFPAKALGKLAGEQALALLVKPSRRLVDRVVKGTPVFRETTDNPPPTVSNHDQNLSEQWALIYQRDNKSRKLDLLRLLKAQVPLAEVMVSAKAPLAELEVDQLSLFLLTHPEDGSRFFSEINLAGQGTNTPYAQPMIPLSFLEPVSSGNYSLICTLEFDDEHFGYMVASCAPDAAEFIEVIGVQLSEVLHADALVRTSEHYRQLNEMNARMASLGSLVSGVAHEINTPIGTGKLAASSLLTATHALQTQISNNSMTRSNFDAYLTDAIEYAEIIFQSLSRAANLISNFKLVSVDQTGEAKRIFDLGDYLTSVLVSLRHQLKGTQVELITDFESGIVVDTYPGAVAQVVTNLFMNALVHGFDDGELAGTIEMRLKKTRSGFELSTQDNGKGANAATVKQIFDPFFTTTRGKGGSGLGMHIVYNLLSQKLFWTIEVQSAQGNGFRALLKPAARHQSFEAGSIDLVEPKS